MQGIHNVTQCDIMPVAKLDKKGKFPKSIIIEVLEDREQELILGHSMAKMHSPPTVKQMFDRVKLNNSNYGRIFEKHQQYRTLGKVKLFIKLKIKIFLFGLILMQYVPSSQPANQLSKQLSFNSAKSEFDESSTTLESSSTENQRLKKNCNKLALTENRIVGAEQKTVDK